jgi:hypothetical protein
MADARLQTLQGNLLYRPNNQERRLHQVQVMLLYRVGRVWSNIPGAQKIWVPGGLPPEESAYFRREFEVGTGVISGVTLQMIADLTATVFLNGAQIGTYTAGDELAQIETYNVSAAWVHTGQNVLAFKVTPEPNQPGVLEYALTVY